MERLIAAVRRRYAPQGLAVRHTPAHPPRVTVLGVCGCEQRVLGSGDTLEAALRAALEKKP